MPTASPRIHPILARSLVIMSETPPPSLPSAGWYPDPADANRRRYWDGTGWTEHVAPGVSAAWGAPASRPGPLYQPYAGPPMPAYAAYVPQQEPLAPSGMRRIPELFSDAGRIIRRAWWQILVVSLVLWLAWAVVAAIAALSLVNVGNAVTAIETSSNALNEYPTSRFPTAVQDEIRQAWEQVPRTNSVLVWVLVGVVLLVLTFLVGACQVAAINRLAMDGASGQPVSVAAALRSARGGGVRLFGYYWLIFAVVFVVTGLAVGLVALAAMLTPVLAVLLGIVLFAGFTVVSVWLLGRLVPLPAQAVVAPGALRWSWQATQGKFWAVLGRYLLWALVASVVGQVITSIVVFPFSLLAGAGASTGSTSTFAVTTGVLYLVSIALSMAVSAITYIGVVPIWRDLIDDPTYRSIGPDGLPVPHPS